MVHPVSVGTVPANMSSGERPPDPCTGRGVGTSQPGALGLQPSRAGIIAIENRSDNGQEAYAAG